VVDKHEATANSCCSQKSEREDFLDMWQRNWDERSRPGYIS